MKRALFAAQMFGFCVSMVIFVSTAQGQWTPPTANFPATGNVTAPLDTGEDAQYVNGPIDFSLRGTAHDDYVPNRTILFGDGQFMEDDSRSFYFSPITSNDTILRNDVGSLFFTGATGVSVKSGGGGIIIDSAGNIGIKTDNPKATLDVAGRIVAKQSVETEGFSDYAQGAKVTVSAGTLNAGGPTARTMHSLWDVTTFPSSITLDFGSGTETWFTAQAVAFNTNWQTDARWVPKDYTIDVSPDNATWTNVVTVTNYDPAKGTNIYHSIAPGYFRYLRINITAPQTSNHVIIATLQVLNIFGSGIGRGPFTPTVEGNATFLGGKVGIGDTNPRGLLQVTGNPLTSGDVGTILEVSDKSANGTNTTYGGIMLTSAPGYDFSIGKKSVNRETYFQIRRQDGVELVTIATSGNVGIGTMPTPGVKLEVAGTIKITGGSPSAGRVLTSDANGLASWVTPPNGIGGSGTTNYVSKFTGASVLGDSQIFDNGTNVGVGASDPKERVQIGNTNPAAFHDGGDKALSWNAYYSGGWKFITGGNYATQIYHSPTGGTISLKTSNSGGVAGSAITWNTGLVVNKSGNVGIGVNPLTKLDLGGLSWVSLPSTNGINFGQDSDGAFLGMVDYGDNRDDLVMRIYDDANDMFRIQTSAGNDIAIFRNDGKVGIGDTNPRGLLQVTGNPLTSGDVGTILEVSDKSAVKTNATPTYGGIMLTSGPGYDFSIGKKTMNNNTNETYFQIRRQDGVELVTIATSGNVGIGTDSPKATLDVAGRIIAKQSVETEAFNDYAQGAKVTISAGTLNGGGPTARTAGNSWDVSTFPSTITLDFGSGSEGWFTAQAVAFNTNWQTDSRWTPKNYTIDVSPNNSTWTNVVTVTNYDPSKGTNIYHSIAPGFFRYLRINVTAPQTSGRVIISTLQVLNIFGSSVGRGPFTPTPHNNAVFLGGNVGIGATDPSQLLTVQNGNALVSFGNLLFETPYIATPEAFDTAIFKSSGGSLKNSPTTYKVTYGTEYGETKAGAGVNIGSPAANSIYTLCLKAPADSRVAKYYIYRKGQVLSDLYNFYRIGTISVADAKTQAGSCATGYGYVDNGASDGERIEPPMINTVAAGVYLKDDRVGSTYTPLMRFGRNDANQNFIGINTERSIYTLQVGGKTNGKASVNPNSFGGAFDGTNVAPVNFYYNAPTQEYYPYAVYAP